VSSELHSSFRFCLQPDLFVFAVTHLEEMLQDIRKRYYAMDFMKRRADHTGSVTDSGWRAIAGGWG
jgi:hypothetical protein